MNLSKADRRITLQSQSATIDSYGDRANTWTDIATVFAQVSISGGIELVRAKKLFDSAEAVFIIRWRTDITPQTRIVYEGNNWGIISVEEIGRKDSLKLVARRFNNV